MNSNPRSRAPTLLAACLAAASLAACHDHRMAANSGICAEFKTGPNGQPITANVPAAGSDAAAPVDDCVRRWAYSLAGAKDDADVVAQSVVAACAAPLSRWNQATLAQPDATSGAGAADSTQGLSLTNGEPTSPLSAHATFAQSRALLYVIEARAGHCAAPSVSNGAPVGAG